MSEEISKPKTAKAVGVLSSRPTSSRTSLPSALPAPVGPTSWSLVLPERKYFKIGEVAELVGVEPHVLRYWETQFSQLRPHKARSGHRLYRRREVETLLLIKDLLHIQRFTIAGARQALRPTPAPRVEASEVQSLASVPEPASRAPVEEREERGEELDEDSDDEELDPDSNDEDSDDDEGEEELEFHLAGPLGQRENEVEVGIEACDGADLDEALSEQLATQMAQSRSVAAGVSRIEVSAHSRVGRDSVRTILTEAATELEAVIVKLKRS